MKPSIDQRILECAQAIVTCWSEWEEEAGRTAQIEQSSKAGRDVLLESVKAELAIYFGDRSGTMR